MKAVIMAGEQGTRFWPVSRERFPKQFLKISGAGTMLQETVKRLSPVIETRDVYIVCSPVYRDLVKEQLPELEDKQLILEPMPRNTAPCIGLAAIYLRRHFGDETLAVLASDHSITENEEFHRALTAGEKLATSGWLVTFGIEPDYPATGYGYLHRGEPVGRFEGLDAYRVRRFAEKPPEELARQFVSSGEYYWNSGMFMWTTGQILCEIERHMPDLFGVLQKIEESWDDAARFADLFSRAPSTSIDYGVMERAGKVAMLACRLGWSDVGNWKALLDIWNQDSNQNFANGPYLSHDTSNCLFYTSGERLVCAVGLRDLVVVETPDVTLVCPQDRVEEVKKLVEQLRAKKMNDYL